MILARYPKSTSCWNSGISYNSFQFFFLFTFIIDKELYLSEVYTLEQVIDATRKDPAKKAAAERADAFIKKLDVMIEDDMNKYRDSHTKNKYTWPVERYDEVRSEITGLILQLHKK